MGEMAVRELSNICCDDEVDGGLFFVSGVYPSVFQGSESLDVTLFLFLEDFVHGEEYAAFFHVAEFVVDGCAEHSHCGREVHVGVHQGRDSEAVGAYGSVEDLEVGFVVAAVEEFVEFFGVCACLEGRDGAHELVGIREIFVEEVEDIIISLPRVVGDAGCPWVFASMGTLPYSPACASRVSASRS